MLRLMLMVDDHTRDRLLFGLNLRRARQLAGDMSQETLAELLGPPVGQRDISRWEHGREPRLAMRRRIADVLHQPLDFFYDESVFDDQ